MSRGLSGNFTAAAFAANTVASRDPPQKSEPVSSYQDAVCIRDEHGKRRTIYLGKYGTAAAQRRYRQVLAEHLAGKTIAPARAKPKTEVSEFWF